MFAVWQQHCCRNDATQSRQSPDSFGQEAESNMMSKEGPVAQLSQSSPIVLHVKG
jgi:hypothetical protein